ncbi:uncharacterized protein Jarid2 [Prorops nasuta]|uniref:uncharacterized protein Jarid2 n=1 Tax=Prorops nasuta TaxID=863751 RepID=UPI0034CDEDC5
MVLNRHDKRKRKEGDLVDLMDPLSVSSKKTKVHAQRKFAQGVSMVFNPSQTTVKDKEKVKPSIITELITNKRPNTNDFLTFLCFRGTSVLPSEINFFNQSPKKEKNNKSYCKQIDSIPSSSTSPLLVHNIKSDGKKQDISQKTFKKIKPVIPDKKKVSGGMQKSITKFIATTSTVQALKKKYQEQRLAKQRIKNKFKTTCVMRTRSSTEHALLKSGIKLAPRKFLPRIDMRKHSLRSNVTTEKLSKSLIKSKPVVSKSKKIIPSKQKNKDSSDSETASTLSFCSEESYASLEKSQNEKSISLVKKIVHKTIRKKICTRSKSEMRRITRSHSEALVPPNLCQRPSRKTKEAAAVYMEILGRKLVSPDIENDDNLSVDSFPELPNARRMAQTESEIKSKLKLSMSKIPNRNKKKSESLVKDKEKLKSGKNVLKIKKNLKIQRYCDVESDEESSSSVEINNTRPITRRSSSTMVKPVSRSLRSSSKNSVVKNTEVFQSNMAITRLKSHQKNQQNTIKTNRDNLLIKRKRNQTSISIKPTSEKSVVCKRSKVGKTKEKRGTESDEETLGMLLNKIKKKQEYIDANIVEKSKFTVADTCLTNKVQHVKQELFKVSDDEESFRGFTNKPVLSAFTTLQKQLDNNIDVSTVEEDTTPDKINDNTKQVIKDELLDTVFVNQTTVNTPTMPLIVNHNFIKPSKPLMQSSSNPTLKTEKKYNHDNPPATSNENVKDVDLSTLHVARKERVNMSTEQIEKWLNESSLAKEESKLEMEENVSGFRYDSVTTTEKIKADISHLSISTKIHQLVRPVNVTLSKLAEKIMVKGRTNVLNKNNAIGVSSYSLPTEADRPQSQADPVIENKILNNDDSIKEVVMSNEKLTAKVEEVSPIGDSETSNSKSDINSLDGSDKKSSEKKAIFQPRKPFQPKVKERRTSMPSANAFSPENERSVYAFESETETPVNTPFRRKNRDSKSSKSISPEKANETYDLSGIATEKTEKGVYLATGAQEIIGKSAASKDEPNEKEIETVTLKNTNTFELPKSFAGLANMQVLPLDKLTTTWSNVNCSASIAVQVNLDDQLQEPQLTEIDNDCQQKSTEISTQTEHNHSNDDDNEDQLFYIPLQAIGRGGSNLIQGQQVIQGVAVKLGTEGPNQRVLLRAKLVTKPPITVARIPPVGTVQPTTRIPPAILSATLENPQPSTSSTTPQVETNTSTGAILSNTPSVNTLDNAYSTNIASIATVSSSNDKGLDKIVKSPKNSRERKSLVEVGKGGKRAQIKSKPKFSEQHLHTNNTIFPSVKAKTDEARLVEAPTFHPTEKDFQDPLEYIEKIRPIAEKFGICRVVPPPNFKPECKVSDDMRFTAYNQYVHRMLHRWGPNVKEMMAIKKYLATQSITLTHPPWIGGMEVDLPHLYQTVQSLGGLKEVIEKKKWQKVADGMKIPKSAQDRVTKLDDIYCKYLLPYDTLSPEEREKLFDEVEKDWIKRENKILERQDSSSSEEDEEEDSSDEIEECIVKGRNMPLNAFYRIARNTQRMWFGEANSKSGNETEGASASEVEIAFWKHVAERKRHVCVHAASIDSSGRGFGFSVAKNSPFARHPWNLKVFTNNAGSVLRALGPLMGVTVPTLHVGMLFSACCWYRDPHGLPWIEYLHTGAKKIWYGIPDEHNNSFRKALSKMVPRYCKSKTIWLPSDTAMVPPELLVNNGVPLCQTVQEPGQFIVVFPKAFTSSICTGYVVSESVYFAQSSWLETAEQVFRDIQDSCEPSIFSFEKLLFNLINDSRSHIDVLKQILPMVTKIRDKEIEYRKKLFILGLSNKKRLPLPDSNKRKKGKQVQEEEGDFECETCRANLFVSLMSNTQEETVYCLEHAAQILTKKKQILKHCTLMFTYSEDELDDLIKKLKDRIEAKSKKK